MKRRRLAGRDVPVIGQGTWEMERAGHARAVAALRLGLDLGLTHVDTAEMYGNGEVEEIVGEAIGSRRDDVFLVSKVLPSNASRAGTVAASERSLRRLRTDRLDLYLLHWRDGERLPEAVAAFEALQRAGKIRAWGVSNFDVPDLEEALALAGPGAIACNQVLYHLEERAIEHAVIPWCEAHGVAVVAYSPFGSGRFPSPLGRGGKALAGVAARHGATPRQVGLAFLSRRESVLTIPKAARLEHVRDNAAAGALVLDASDLATLEAAFPLQPRPTHLPMI